MRPQHADRRARRARPLIYVPNSGSDTVDVIDPATWRVIGVTGRRSPSTSCRRGICAAVRDERPRQHADAHRPGTGSRGRPIPVADPYNLYFTPDGTPGDRRRRAADRLDFRDPHTFAAAPLTARAVRGRRPHRLLRRRPLSARHLRVRRADSSRSTRARARRRHLRLPEAPAGCLRTSSSRRTGRSSTSPT